MINHSYPLVSTLTRPAISYSYIQSVQRHIEEFTIHAEYNLTFAFTQNLSHITLKSYVDALIQRNTPIGRINPFQNIPSSSSATATKNMYRKMFSYLPNWQQKIKMLLSNCKLPQYFIDSSFKHSTNSLNHMLAMLKMCELILKRTKIFYVYNLYIGNSWQIKIEMGWQ